GDYQLLFYTANHAGLFGSYSAAFRVVDAPYTGPCLYDAEGATTIAYQSYDNADNLEDLRFLGMAIPSPTLSFPRKRESTPQATLSLPLTICRGPSSRKQESTGVASGSQRAKSS
ncbi:MAG: hypothetical protein JXB07_06345, partial [Anaerolineae bacterium]|nr:hypothetical protein [Anaerolineae bacterium]